MQECLNSWMIIENGMSREQTNNKNNVNVMYRFAVMPFRSMILDIQQQNEKDNWKKEKMIGN